MLARPSSSAGSTSSCARAWACAAACCCCSGAVAPSAGPSSLPKTAHLHINGLHDQRAWRLSRRKWAILESEERREAPAKEAAAPKQQQPAAAHMQRSACAATPAPAHVAACTPPAHAGCGMRRCHTASAQWQAHMPLLWHLHRTTLHASASNHSVVQRTRAPQGPPLRPCWHALPRVSDGLGPRPAASATPPPALLVQQLQDPHPALDQVQHVLVVHKLHGAGATRKGGRGVGVGGHRSAPPWQHRLLPPCKGHAKAKHECTGVHPPACTDRCRRARAASMQSV